MILFWMWPNDYVLSVCFSYILLPKKPLQNVVALNNNRGLSHLGWTSKMAFWLMCLAPQLEWLE